MEDGQALSKLAFGTRVALIQIIRALNDRDEVDIRLLVAELHGAAVDQHGAGAPCIGLESIEHESQNCLTVRWINHAALSWWTSGWVRALNTRSAA